MWGQSNSLPHSVIPAGTSVLLGPVSCPAEVGLGRAVAVTVALCVVLRKPGGKGHSSFLREAAISGGLQSVLGLRQQQPLVLTGVDRLTCPRDGGNEHCKSESALARVQLPALLRLQ